PRATYPGDREAGHFVPPLFGLAPYGVCQAAEVASGAGALLPHRFTLTGRRVRPFGWKLRLAVCSLLHFPSRRRAWPLASVLPFGVRTFLPDVPGRPSSRLRQAI